MRGLGQPGVSADFSALAGTHRMWAGQAFSAVNRVATACSARGCPEALLTPQLAPWNSVCSCGSPELSRNCWGW